MFSRYPHSRAFPLVERMPFPISSQRTCTPHMLASGSFYPLLRSDTRRRISGFGHVSPGFRRLGKALDPTVRRCSGRRDHGMTEAGVRWRWGRLREVFAGYPRVVRGTVRYIDRISRSNRHQSLRRSRFEDYESMTNGPHLEKNTGNDPPTWWASPGQTFVVGTSHAVPYLPRRCWTCLRKTTKRHRSLCIICCTLAGLGFHDPRCAPGLQGRCRDNCYSAWI